MPSDGRHHHAGARWRVGVTNEPADVLEIPTAIAWHGQKYARFRFARISDGDAASGRLKEDPALPERMPQRLPRLADRPQMPRQLVEELEELEFPGCGQHDSAPGSCERPPDDG